MSRRLDIFTVIAVGLLNCTFLLNSAPAQLTVATDPVGFTTTTLLGGSDSLISVPFTRPPEFIGAIASTSGNTITLAGSPLTANQFLYGGAQHNHYYALIGPISGTGTKEGHTFQIADNSINSLTVVTGSDNLNGIPVNTQVEVIPYWTPATIFPASDANVSFTPTASPPSYQTLLRVPNYSASGIDLPYSAEYYFNNNAWQRVSPAGDGSDDPLLPDGYFVVRNANGAPTLPLTNIGSVLLKKLALPLIATVQQQDNPVSMVRPVNIALDATGLGPGDSSFGAGDQLLVFNNAATGFDKSPSATYYYDTAAAIPGWRLTGDTSPSDRGADVIPAGTGFVIRKAAGVQSSFWTNAFPLSAVSVVSRRTHNAAGNFDIPLPLTGNAGVECRSGGITQLIFTFPAAVTLNTGAGVQGGEVTSGAGSVTGVSGATTNTITVGLSGASSGFVTVTLHGVNDGTYTNDVAVRAAALSGDSTGDRSVNSADISQTKSRSGQAVNATNFRSDVTVDGSLNSADISLVKSRSGTALP